MEKHGSALFVVIITLLFSSVIEAKDVAYTTAKSMAEQGVEKAVEEGLLDDFDTRLNKGKGSS